MIGILEAVLPVFSLVLLGFVVGRPPVFGPGAAKALGTFVFYLAMPALLFRSMAQQGLPGRDEMAIVATYYVGVVIAIPIVLATMHLLFREGLAEAATLTLGGLFSNLVLFGVPLAVPVFGQEGLPLVLLIITFHATVLIGGMTILVEMARVGRDGQGPLAVIASTAVALVRNPVIVSILGGTLWGALGLGLPGIIDRTISLLGAAGVPCALFAMGADLVGIRVNALAGRTLVMSVFKLLVLPVVIWLVGTYVFALPPFQLSVVVVLASLPVGLNVFIFAQRYDIHVSAVAGAVLLTTALAAVTTTLAVLWLVPR